MSREDLRALDRPVLLVVPGRSSRAAGIDAKWIAAAGLAAALERVEPGVQIVDASGPRDPGKAVSQSVRDVQATSSARGAVRRLPTSLRPAVGDLAAVRGDRALARRLRELGDRPFGAVVQFHHRFQRAGVDFARRRGIPVAIRVEALEVREEDAWGVHRPGYGGFVERFGEIDVLKRADLVVPVSAELDRLLAVFGIPDRRRLIVPNGVDLDAFSPRPKVVLGPGEPFVVGWVGGFRPFHGLGIVGSFVDELRSRVPHAVVHLVGAGPLRDELADLARRSGGALRVTGAVAHEKVPELLRSFDACVLFSEPGPFHYSPLKLLEYLACGRPVVAPRVGDLPGWLTDGRDALLVPQADPRGLAEAVRRIATNPELAASLEVEGRRTAERSASWDKAVGCILDALHACPPANTGGRRG